MSVLVRTEAAVVLQELTVVATFFVWQSENSFSIHSFRQMRFLIAFFPLLFTSLLELRKDQYVPLECFILLFMHDMGGYKKNKMEFFNSL